MAEHNEVDVKFGAQIGELVEGVNHVKEKLDEVGEHAKHLAELFGIALSLEAFKEFVESMSELGEQTERSMAILGVSAEVVGSLQGVAKLTGTSFEALQSSIGRMGQRLQQSTRNEFNPAAQGLKALGIEAKELIGVPADQYLARLAEGFGKLNPSMNTTSAAQMSFGRGIVQLLPMLLKGKEHLEELQHAWAATGAEMTDTQAKAFAETHEKLELLGGSMQGLGIKIFDILRPAIDSAVEGITHLVQSVSATGLRDTVNTIAMTLIDWGEKIALFFLDVGESISNVIKELKKQTPILTAMVTAVNLIELAARGLNAGIDKLIGLLSGTETGFKTVTSETDKAREAVVSFANAARAAVDAHVPKSGTWAAEIAEAQAMGRVIEDLAAQYNKVNVAQTDTRAREHQQMAIDALHEEVKVANEAYERRAAADEASVKLHQMTEDQKLADLRGALNERINAELDANTKELALLQVGTLEYQKAQEKRREIYAKTSKDLEKLTQQTVEVDVKAWESALTPIQSAWDGQLKGLLAGTTSWAQAMKNIVADLVIALIKKLEELVFVEQIANALKSAFGGTPDISGAIRAIAQNVSVAYTGFVANLALTQGPAAIPEGAALAAAVAATAAVPAADIGGYVISGGLALIHPGEEIVPASIAQPYSGPGGVGGGGVGGGGVNVHIHTIDAGGVQAFVRKYAGQLTSAVQAHVGSNPTSFAR